MLTGHALPAPSAYYCPHRSTRNVQRKHHQRFEHPRGRDILSHSDPGGATARFKKGKQLA